VFSLPTVCAPAASGDSARVTAASPEALANGQLTIGYMASQTLTSDGGLIDPNGPVDDPLAHAAPVPGAHSPCVTSAGPAVGGFTGVSDPLPGPVTYVGLGYVDVPYAFTGQTGQLDARVWDVAPSGETVLVSRGTYRLDVAGYDPATGTLRLPLFGNHWHLELGHRLRLDLTQVDQPYLRPSNPVSTLSFTNPHLVLPTREAHDLTLRGR